MSWSFTKIGTVKEVTDALDEQSENLSGQSKVEFDDALPHIKALVEQNFHKAEGATEPKVNLSAHGHGSARDGEQVDRECCISLKALSILAMIIGMLSTSLAYAQDVKPVQAAVQKDHQVQAPLKDHIQKDHVQAPVQKQFAEVAYRGDCGAGACLARGARGALGVGRAAVAVSVRPLRGVRSRRSARAEARASARAGFWH